MKTIVNLKKALLALCCVSLMLTVPACKDKHKDSGYTKTTTTRKTKKRGKSGKTTTATTATKTKTTKASKPKMKKAKKSKGATTEQIIDNPSTDVTLSHTPAETVVVE